VDADLRGAAASTPPFLRRRVARRSALCENAVGAGVAELVDARDLKFELEPKICLKYLKFNSVLNLNELHNPYTKLDFYRKSAYAYAYVHQS